MLICSQLSSVSAAGKGSVNLSSSFGNVGGPSFATGSVQVQITAIGSTPSSAVTTVKALMSHYAIAANDARNVHMGSGGLVHLYLASTASDYELALRRIGVTSKQADSLSNDTSGFTLGNDIVVPLFQNAATADLVNTVAHELTHALFNANVGQIPSWLDEGLAVSDGMYAQARVQGATAYLSYAKQMAQIVYGAVENHQLLSLAANESSVYNANYDVELQDWLSVQYLMQRFGYSFILSYFSRLKLGESDDMAFSHTFGMTFATFNHQFTQLLQSTVHGRGGGLKIRIVYPGTYNGEISIVHA